MRVLRHHWPALLIFALALAVYVTTLCPTVFVEGTGENIVCAWTLSVPHPPGFPLFCLLGKGFAELVRIGSVAHRINLFSAVMGAVAVAALYLLLGALGIGRLAAAAAALALAFSSTFWRQATIAEVYTLSLTLVIVQLTLLARWRHAVSSSARPSPLPAPKGKRRERRAEPTPSRTSPDRYLVWFALAFGLGMTVHYNHLLLLPAYLYFILTTDPSLLRRGRTWVKGIILAALGFSLHLYAPIRSLANPPIDWGNPQTLSNWWRYLTAEQYRGRMFHLTLAKVISNLGTFLADLPAEFWWLGLGAALGGAVVLFRRDRRLFWTTILIVAVGLVWSINYDIPWEINVYYLQALLALVIWLAFGLQWFWERLARPRLRLASVIVFAVPALVITANYRVNDLSDETFVFDNAMQVLGSTGGSACVVLPATNPTFAVLYAKYVEGWGEKTTLYSQVDAGILLTSDAVAPPDSLSPDRAPLPSAQWLLRNSGIPLFWVDRPPQGDVSGHVLVPWGCLYRAVPIAEKEQWVRRAPTPTPPPFNISERPFSYGAEERLTACRYLLVQGDYAWQHDDKAEADGCYQQAARIGASLADISAQLGLRYGEQGREDLAVQTYEKGIARKDDALLRNRLGAIYGRQNRLADAEEQFQAAIKLKPDDAEAYANLGSVYGRMGRIEDAVAQTEKALAYNPANLLALRNLGFAYAQMGRTGDARRLLQRALDINPNQEDVRGLLGSL